MTPHTRRYKQVLFRARLGTGTINKYLSVIESGLREGDVLAPLRRAAADGKAAHAGVAKAALVYWARMLRDQDMLEEIEQIVVPPRPETPPTPTLTPELRDQVVEWCADQLPPPLQAVIVLVAYSGHRPGAILHADRSMVAKMVRDLAPEQSAMIAPLLRGTSWTYVYEVVAGRSRGDGAAAAYASVRRVLRRAAEALGFPPFPVEDFRRVAAAADAAAESAPAV